MKIIKEIILSTLLSFTLYTVWAQEDPQFAYNTENNLFTNPGFSGMGEDQFCAKVINRQQWVGFEGAPVTTYAGIHGKLKILGIPSGVGISILNDIIGLENKFQAKASYAYHTSILGGKMGIGLDVGFINFLLNGQFNAREEDPIIPTGSSGQLRKLIFDLGVGAYYRAGNFFAGISAAHIHQPKINYNQADEASFLRRHLYAVAGYRFNLTHMPLEFEPTVFLKSDQVKFQQDYNITATYNKKFWVGVTYRNKDALVPMIGVKLFNGLKIGYAYELSLSGMIKHNSGSHEVMIGYCFGFYQSPGNIKFKSVRFL